MLLRDSLCLLYFSFLSQSLFSMIYSHIEESAAVAQLLH